ncbi:hypothetical protein C8R44DRAFT_976119 [Mycena epipterygia]|nr:hypothetical protein C8R44DRAFT_976119 [Mycena epipterygia]
MLSLLRHRALPVLRLVPRTPGLLSASLRTSLPAFYSTAPAATSAKPKAKGGLGYMVCPNCRREGHLRSDCKEPTVCIACGVEGHERRDCPSPDPARIEALQTAPRKWCVRLIPSPSPSRIVLTHFSPLPSFSRPLCSFRCGEPGHILKECKQPPKCFSCGSTSHILKNCPTAPPRPAKAPAPDKVAA